MARLAIHVDEHAFSVELPGQSEAGKLYLWLDDKVVVARVPPAGAPLGAFSWLVIDGHPFEIELDPEMRWIATASGRYDLEVRNLEDIAVHSLRGNGRVKAPIPGQITRLFVAKGQAVEANQLLCVLEAMKMENEIHAPQAGLVSALPIAVGRVVSRGQLLAEISSG